MSVVRSLEQFSFQAASNNVQWLRRLHCRWQTVPHTSCSWNERMATDGHVFGARNIEHGRRRHMFSVKSLLTVKKVLLVRKNLVDVLFRGPMLLFSNYNNLLVEKLTFAFFAVLSTPVSFEALARVFPLFPKIWCQQRVPPWARLLWKRRNCTVVCFESMPPFDLLTDTPENLPWWGKQTRLPKEVNCWRHNEDVYSPHRQKTQKNRIQKID